MGKKIAAITFVLICSSSEFLSSDFGLVTVWMRSDAFLNCKIIKQFAKSKPQFSVACRVPQTNFLKKISMLNVMERFYYNA